MIKKLLFFSAFVFSMFVTAQENLEDDIFVQDKAGYLILKPAVEKRIKEISTKETDRLIKKYVDSIKTANPLYSQKDILSDNKKYLDFERDKLLLSTYIDVYNEYLSSTTTMGTNWMMSFYITEYDKLLNKYYKLALAELTPSMKQKVIESQRKWLAYYENEKKLLYDITDFGNHNSFLFAKGPILDMMQNRVDFLYSIYNRDMPGSNTYIENNY